MPQKLRGGIIGCGYFAQFHIAAWKRMADVELAAAWEEALEMARVARGGAAPLVIHENWRWQPWYREAFRRIHAGEIGKPVSYHLRTRQRDGLGDNPYPRQPYFSEM